MNTRHALQTALLALSLLSSSAQGYFEEDITITSDAPQRGDKRVSTVHFQLSRALSRCAGFDAEESEKIATWNQLTDSLTLESPMFGTVSDSTMARSGENEQFGHWARAIDLVVMENYVYGEGDLFECQNTNCTERRYIETELQPLTHETFGVYLHMVLDSYSHSDCISSGYRSHNQKTPECPLHTHTDEFGDEAASRAYSGIRAMYQELVTWGMSNDTMSRVIPETVETFMVEFVSAANYNEPVVRAQIADDLYNLCASHDERE